MGPNEEALRETLFLALFGGEKVDADFRKILGHSLKRSGLGITDPHLSAEITQNTLKSACWELVGSILGGTNPNYVGHRACVRGASERVRKERVQLDMADIEK